MLMENLTSFCGL